MSPGFELAQARSQARHGQRLAEATWRRLGASSSFGHFLEAARGTALRRWVAHLSTASAPAEIEQTLREDWARQVAEVASWVPERWRPAVAWLEAAPAVALGAAGMPAREWVARFRALWPAAWPAERRALEGWLGLLAQHGKAMTADDAADGWALRAALDVSVSRFYRLHAGEPVAAFCHLTLVALDLERLRGALIRRALAPDVRSEVAWV